MTQDDITAECVIIFVKEAKNTVGTDYKKCMDEMPSWTFVSTCKCHCKWTQTKRT